MIKPNSQWFRGGMGSGTQFRFKIDGAIRAKLVVSSNNF